MERRNLKTFGNMRKSFKSVINNKDVHLKEDKNLMPKFLITARKRQQLELEECLGNYEFCVVLNHYFLLTALRKNTLISPNFLV